MCGHSLRGSVDWNDLGLNDYPIFEVTPCVGVWIEMLAELLAELATESLPAWECGLKSSHIDMLLCYSYRHSLRGSVDWNIFCHPNTCQVVSVTPCVGVWIEISVLSVPKTIALVTPCVGVWIEMFFLHSLDIKHGVTPCVGVWIEISFYSFWLKCSFVTPCVGVWIEIMSGFVYRTVCLVTPCVGVWIEIRETFKNSPVSGGHSLRGSVDWNVFIFHFFRDFLVTPCVGVWIEI